MKIANEVSKNKSVHYSLHLCRSMNMSWHATLCGIVPMLLFEQVISGMISHL